VKQIPCDSEKSGMSIPGVLMGNTEYPEVKAKHQNSLQEEQNEGGKVEIKGVVNAFAQPVIQGKRRHNHRPVGLVGRERTECGRALEKYGYIADIPYVDVIDDRMGIVKMEAVVKMIGIRKEDRDQENHSEDIENMPIFCGHINYSLL
jgi:hypothetical protein